MSAEIATRIVDKVSDSLMYEQSGKTGVRNYFRIMTGIFGTGTIIGALINSAEAAATLFVLAAAAGAGAVAMSRRINKQQAQENNTASPR